MKKILKFISQAIRYIATAIVGIYIVLIVLLNIPVIQTWSSQIIASSLSSKLDSKVTIGHIDIGLLNRIIITDLEAWDQNGKKMLSVKKVSAKIHIEDLFKIGKVSIATAQLFDFNANLYKQTATSPTNFQFVLDAFSSKEKKEDSKLNLRINSLIIRRGNISYNELYQPITEGRFSTHHINVKDFSSYISLKALNKDSLNVFIRDMEFKEQSGFELKKLTARILANNKGARISDFMLKANGSNLKIDNVNSTFEFKDGKLDKQSLKFDGEIKDMYVTAKDFAAFVPALQYADEKIYLDGTFEGTANYVSINGINLRNKSKDIQLNANATISHLSDGEPMQVFAKVGNLNVTSSGASTIFYNIKGKEAQAPEIISRLDFVKYAGTLQYEKNNIRIDGKIDSGAGSVIAEAEMKNQKDFLASLSSDELALGKLLGNEKFDKTAFEINVNGLLQADNNVKADVVGNVDFFDYNNYRYENISLNSTIENQQISGKLNVDDKNVTLYADGFVHNLSSNPEIKASLQVDKIRPYDLNLTKDYKNTEFSFEMDAHTKGKISNMQGSASITDFHMKSENDSYALRNFSVSTGQSDNSENVIDVKSDFFDAHLNGNINYASLPQSINNLMHKYLPTIFKYKAQPKIQNSFVFSMKIKNASPLEKLLGIPLKVNKQGVIDGEFDEKEEYFSMRGFLPSFEYGSNKFGKAIIRCKNNEDAIDLKLNIAKIGKSSIVNIGLNAEAGNDKINTKLDWCNNLEVSYSGLLDVTTSFGHENDRILTDVQINPSEIIIADSIWDIKKSDIVISGKGIDVKNFMLSHAEQHLGINGIVSDNPSDSLVADLKDINIEYILDIVNFTAVDFSGKATGKVYASNLKKQPKADAQLFVKRFIFNTSEMGDMSLYAKWNNEEKGIMLEGRMQELGVSRTNVNGYIYPTKNALDLWINADQTDLAMLNRFVGGVFSNIRGRGVGGIHLHGPFKELNLEGDVCANVKAKVKILNTEYEIKNDTVHLRHNYMDFNGITIYDRYGHMGFVNGYVKHENLKNMNYMFKVQANGLLAYDERKFGEMPFYGTIFGNGTATISGGNNTLTTEVNMSPAPNSTFVYNAGRADDITSNQFITFVDKTPKEIPWIPAMPSGEQKQTKVVPDNDDDDIPMDLRINMLLDINQNATIKLIMDPVSGDYITCNGSGSLKANYYNKGGFNMFGTLTLDHGVYKLSMQEVIRKDFNIRKGGTVVFGGNPYNADLNIQCVYTVNSASLSELEASAGNNRQSTVKVNCLMNLTGKMMKPDIKFDLELPTISEEERQLVRSLISTDEQMNMQIIYLLGVGRFYTYDYANADANTNRSSSAVNSLLSSTISGQLNQMLSSVLNNNNWSVGTNLSTGNNGWSDMEVEGILSGRLLNNRLLVNGNFGYRDNPLANTNFVGDFDLQWLLTPNGEISLKGYSQTNDRYFTKATLTTQGVGIIFTKEFNNWRNFFRIRTGRRRIIVHNDSTTKK